MPSLIFFSQSGTDNLHKNKIYLHVLNRWMNSHQLAMRADQRCLRWTPSRARRSADWLTSKFPLKLPNQLIPRPRVAHLNTTAQRQPIKIIIRSQVPWKSREFAKSWLFFPIHVMWPGMTVNYIKNNYRITNIIRLLNLKFNYLV